MPNKKPDAQHTVQYGKTHFKEANIRRTRNPLAQHIYDTKKRILIELFLRQTRSPMRSIVSLCEQSGYRRATQKEPIKMRF